MMYVVHGEVKVQNWPSSGVCQTSILIVIAVIIPSFPYPETQSWVCFGNTFIKMDTASCISMLEKGTLSHGT